MSGLPGPFSHSFACIDDIIDEVHGLFDAWAEDGTYGAALDDFSLHVMRLAVHEWMANLVQHANFGERTPEISLALHVEGDGVQCTIEDNSTGFDFERQVREQASLVADIAPGERGRGLLMMIACTDDLQYQVSPEGRQRLSFALRPPIEPDDLAPLFSLANAFGTVDELGMSEIGLEDFGAFPSDAPDSLPPSGNAPDERASHTAESAP